MSNAAITQLLAIGSQDENFLSKEPKDSIFQETDKKITNFARSKASMIPSGRADFGTTIKFKIEKKGDLLSSMYLMFELPELDNTKINNLYNDNYVPWAAWNDYIGNVLIENIRLYIGGQLIDEQTGEYMQIITDLYDDDWNKLAMIGMDSVLNKTHERLKALKDYPLENEYPYNEITNSTSSKSSRTIYVPLKFWFCNSIKKALPIIALQYHDIEIEVKIRKFEDCHKIYSLRKTTEDTDRDVLVLSKSLFTYNQIPKIKEVKLDCNFIFLNSEERKKIAQSEHKILINQTQRITQPVKFEKSVELNFNHPVKEMFWFFRNNKVTSEDGPFNFSTSSEYPDLQVFNRYDTSGNRLLLKNYNSKEHWLAKARLLINGHERIDWKDYMYYYYLQNYENFRNKLEHHVYLYSFSLDPKSETPHGSLNFSRIDNAQLQYDINEESRRFFNNQRDREGSNYYGELGKDDNLEINIYATNYNYLLIKSGMAGLAYTS